MLFVVTAVEEIGNFLSRACVCIYLLKIPDNKKTVVFTAYISMKVDYYNIMLSMSSSSAKVFGSSLNG